MRMTGLTLQDIFSFIFGGVFSILKKVQINVQGCINQFLKKKIKGNVPFNERKTKLRETKVI